MGKSISRFGVILLTTVAAGAVGAPAFAATTGAASVSGTKVIFKAGSGQANSVAFTRSGRTITINDRVTVKAGKGCKAVKGDKTKVRCTTAKNPTQITAHLGDRNDALVNKTNIKIYAYGGSGDDRITGGSNSDRLVGDSGNDQIWGAAGNDSLDGGTGNDRVKGGTGHDKIYGGTGANTLAGEDGNDTIHGGSGHEALSGGAGNDRILGSAGNDTINGEAGHDSLDGGSGNDRILGGTGDDKIYGSTGTDRLYANDGNDRLSGGDQNDLLDGGAGNDTLYGDNGNDTLIGDRGDDKEHGGAGDDRFQQIAVTGTDADTFVGNAGKDELTYATRKVGVRISNNGVTGDDGATGERDTTATDIEVLVGTDRNDTIAGGSNNDFLYGRSGEDIIYGGAGNDHLDGGGTGVDDPYADDQGTDKLVGGAGNDRLERGSLVFGDYDTASSTPRPVGADVIMYATTVSYEFADGPVTVDPGNAYGQDGQKGEGDEVTAYRSVIGSPYDDVVITKVGDPWGGFLSGRAGDDYLRVDFADGPCCDGWNDVRVYGGDGADEIDGGGGAYLYGSLPTADDGDPDVLRNGAGCYVHANDTATGCRSVSEL